ncbi:MAG: metallophosphoesterase [Magnetococcales bacterium]|nr:metallophosphoesterase [Magnetococcales bacterium]
MSWFWIFIAVVLAPIPLAFLLDESADLEVTRHRVGEGNGPGVRIVQVSDLHPKPGAKVTERTLEALRQEPHELLIFTGDMVDDRRKLPLLEDFLARLPPNDAPRYAILGNWEPWGGMKPEEMRQLYQRHGVTLLVNESTVVKGPWGEFLLVGLDDLLGGVPDWGKATARHGDWRGPTLLLAHNPDTRDVLRSQGVFSPEGTGRPPPDRLWMLSGHTHGGQIAPFGLHLDPVTRNKPYVAGWYRENGPPLFISRGVGSTVLPIRIGARPEVAVFQWRFSGGPSPP